MCDKIELLINSGDRIQGTTSNYTVQVRTDFIKLPNGKIPTKCKLKGINFTNGMYNINQYNNIITIFETTSTSNTVITLPQGQYNASQLSTQISTSFTTSSKVSNTYTCTYNSQTYKLTITANTQTFYFINTSLLLGMLENSTASLTQTSSQAIKLLYDFLYVRCDLIGEIKNTSLINTPGSFIIPLLNIDLGTSGFIGRSQLPSIEHSFISKPNAQITIYDQYGYNVNLNNTDHQFILELY